MNWALGVGKVVLSPALFLEVGVPVSTGESLFVADFGTATATADGLHWWLHTVGDLPTGSSVETDLVEKSVILLRNISSMMSIFLRPVSP